jgi:hypothetical protein
MKNKICQIHEPITFFSNFSLTMIENKIYSIVILQTSEILKIKNIKICSSNKAGIQIVYTRQHRPQC